MDMVKHSVKVAHIECLCSRDPFYRNEKYSEASLFLPKLGVASSAIVGKGGPVGYLPKQPCLARPLWATRGMLGIAWEDKGK